MYDIQAGGRLMPILDAYIPEGALTPARALLEAAQA
jgi:hypothetical protein